MTDMPPPPGPSTDLRVPAPAAGQFSYHVRMAAVFALAGETVESASESVLAWAILANQWPDAEPAAAEVANELVDQRSAAVSESARSAALARARGLALDIEAHHVSDALCQRRRHHLRRGRGTRRTMSVAPTWAME